jgi:SAM-dependent methyltransferase
MDTLDFPSESVFVDLGSGKGKTLLMAAGYGFKRVVGVEFSPELCEIAKSNWSIYRQGSETDPAFEIVNTDVVDYAVKDDENVFFMFHPFDDVVMDKVIQNVEASHERAPRKIWIIYYNPVFQDLLEGRGTFRRVSRTGQRGGSFAVYVR